MKDCTYPVSGLWYKAIDDSSRTRTSEREQGLPLVPEITTVAQVGIEEGTSDPHCFISFLIKQPRSKEELTKTVSTQI